MKGVFINLEECKKYLRSEGFKFNCSNEGRLVFSSNTELAEVYEYEDNSVSILFGKLNLK